MAANNSLFRPAAHSAALRSSQENQQRAFQAVVHLASSQISHGRRGGGALQPGVRGSPAAQTPSSSDGRSQQLVRGTSRSGDRGRSAQQGSAQQGKAATAAESAAAAQPFPPTEEARSALF